MSLTVSIMNGVTNSHPTTSEEANGLATDFVSEGVIGTYTNTGSAAPTTGAFSINAQGTPDMTVAVGSGVAYVQGTPASQNSQMFRVYNSASENVTISANSSGSTKYDWLYIKLDATLLNAPTLAGTTTATLVTSRSTSSSSDDGTPPTYGYPIAVITVSNGASSITNSVIRDIRGNADIGTVAGQNTGWTSGALPAVSSVTENGNRSASMTYASSVANILTPGMRIRTSRTVAAPTYMGGAFNGTNHYFTKTTCTSTLSTVTDNFTVVGYVEPTAYQIGYLCGRADSTPTTGFWLRTEATGQVSLGIFNAGVGNYRFVSTQQSLPLNKKTHIAASWAAGVVVIYFDGVSVPVTTASTSGTAPTAASAAAADFSIGRNGAVNSQYFAGYLSGFGVFNAVLSAATIRSYKNQVLSGSETNCIGAWSLNNTAVNQQAAGTNDLTATNSVGYTSGRSPYCMDATGTAAGTYDFGIVTKVATTVATVQYPEGCAIPTSGGISAVDYSGVKAPFGMPIDSGRWSVSRIDRTQTNTSSNATFAAVTGHSFTVPVGAWEVGWRGNIFNTSTTAVWWCLSDVSQTGLAVSTSDRSLQSIVTSPSAAATHIDVTISKEVAHSATATYQMYTLGATTSAGVLGSSSPYDFTAKLTYL